jgi:hypothetical protein
MSPNIRSGSPANNSEDSQDESYAAPKQVAHHSLAEQFLEKLSDLNDSVSRALGLSQGPLETALETTQNSMIHFIA